jgi:Fe-S-cluster containining protein
VLLERGGRPPKRRMEDRPEYGVRAVPARDDRGPAAFFKAMMSAFGETIEARRDRADFVGALCAQAFDSFEKNVAIQAEGAPALACAGECAACCALRVAATAPEVFLMARFVGVNAAAFAQMGIDLVRRIAETDAEVGGLSEGQRMAARRDCPFIENALCLAYRVRPLACRGHASFDKEACVKAAAGCGGETAVSTPHLVVRGLVQNALMSSLREAGLGWRIYEFNRALLIALSRPDAVAKWVAGEDPLSEAVIGEFDAAEAAMAFDAVWDG